MTLTCPDMTVNRGSRGQTVGRAIGQAVVFGATLVVLQLLILRSLPFVDPDALPFRPGTPSGDVVTGVIATIAIVLYFAVVRLFEGRVAVELALSKRSAVLGAFGAPLGVLLFSLVMLSLVLAGQASVSGVRNVAGSIAALLGSVFAAVTEELLFRGMLFRLLERHAGTSAALVVSAASFGLAHAANPAATWLSSTAIGLEAGVLLGAAYASTRSLWFPIGLHVGWNFTESGLFGAKVSGWTIPGLCRTELVGKTWMTGGAFGPEAGLPAILICLTASLLLLSRSKRVRSVNRVNEF